MSASHRSSGRVDDAPTFDLFRTTSDTNNGADGGSPPLTSQRWRTGSRQLAKIATDIRPREWDVLRSLEKLHFLTTRQIERLHLSPDHYTPLSAIRTARYSLTRLYDLGLVERLQRRVGGVRAGSASFVYRLSPLGARLLHHSTRRRSHEPSLTHLAHVLSVGELVVRLHEAARADHLELLEVQAEPDCWRPIVAPHGGRVLLKPDLRVTLGVGEHELHWFVEVDRGSEHRPVLLRKCIVYVQAWRGGREAASAGVFPRVLWVVPDQPRAEVLEGVSTAVSGAPSGLFVVATDADAIEALAGIGGLA